MQALRNLAGEIKAIDGLKITFFGTNAEFRHIDKKIIASLEILLKQHSFLPGRKGDILVLSKQRRQGIRAFLRDDNVPPFLNLLKSKKI